VIVVPMRRLATPKEKEPPSCIDSFY
jgi:hypothetical protein